MESATILAAACGAAAALLLVAAVLLATRRRRSRHHLEAMLVAAQREVDDLRHRLEELTGPRPAYLEEVFGRAPTAEQAAPDQAPWVITHVGEPDTGPEGASNGVAVPDRLVLSATLGEPLVKAAAFTHGVRRALSAESRNRIWFEMRRETRAARRRRRQLRKRLERQYRANLRAAEDPVMENLA